MHCYTLATKVKQKKEINEVKEMASILGTVKPFIITPTSVIREGFMKLASMITSKRKQK